MKSLQSLEIVGGQWTTNTSASLSRRRLNPDEPAPEKPKVDQSAFLATSKLQPGFAISRGAAKFELSPFPRTMVKDVKRSEFLVLGFDTEYQSPKETFTSDEIAEGKRPSTRFCLYQFHAINSNGVEWSGIAIPGDGERLSSQTLLCTRSRQGRGRSSRYQRRSSSLRTTTEPIFRAFEDRKQILGRLPERSQLAHISIRADLGESQF